MVQNFQLWSWCFCHRGRLTGGGTDGFNQTVGVNITLPVKLLGLKELKVCCGPDNLHWKSAGGQESGSGWLRVSHSCQASAERRSRKCSNRSWKAPGWQQKSFYKLCSLAKWPWRVQTSVCVCFFKIYLKVWMLEAGNFLCTFMLTLNTLKSSGLHTVCRNSNNRTGVMWIMMSGIHFLVDWEDFS